MRLCHTPLLPLQRDLYRRPLGPGRFGAYLDALVDGKSGDMRLPLSLFNPMAKEHMPTLLDALIDMDADGTAAAATAEAERGLQAANAPSGSYRVCLVAADDVKGGWTDRYSSDLDCRFKQQAHYRRGWIVATLWASRDYAPASVRRETLLAIYRAEYALRHGTAADLGAMLAQEGYAMRRAGAPGPPLEEDDLDYTRQVLAPFLRRADLPALVGALYGDPAARALGYRPMGLSPGAGFALARALADDAAMV